MAQRGLFVRCARGHPSLHRCAIRQQQHDALDSNPAQMIVSGRKVLIEDDERGEHVLGVHELFALKVEAALPGRGGVAECLLPHRIEIVPDHISPAELLGADKNGNVRIGDVPLLEKAEPAGVEVLQALGPPHIERELDLGHLGARTGR
eukprot:1733097-Prymnesium_polylepis.1